MPMPCRTTVSKAVPLSMFGLEPLEQRALLAFAVADYFPMAGGNTWNYSGTSNGQVSALTMKSVAGIVEAGVSTTRFRLVHDDAGGRTIEGRFLTLDQDGLQWLRRNRTEAGVMQIDRAAGGLRLLPSSFEGGSGPFVDEGPYSRMTGPQVARGRVSLSTTIDTNVNLVVHTPAGTFQALQVDVVMQGRLTRVGTQDYIDYEYTETQYWAKGIGIVSFEYTLEQRPSNGPAESDTVNMLLESSSITDRAGFELYGNGEFIFPGSRNPSPDNDTTFGSVDIRGYDTLRTYTLRNDSRVTMTFGAVSINGRNESEFTVVSPPQTSLAPGETTTLTVRFDPAAVGARFTYINIPTSDPLIGIFAFRVRGTGLTPPQIEVRSVGSQSPIANGSTTPTFADGTRFGQVETDGDARVERSFVITNTGIGPLIFQRLTRISFIGAAAGDFGVASRPDARIEPGASTTFTLWFNPKALGARRVTVGLATNQPLGGFSFVVAGMGI